MTRSFLTWAALLLALGFATGCSRQTEPPAPSPAGPAVVELPAASRPAEPRKVELDLDKAIEVAMPQPAELLKPVAFKTPDGKDGWVVKVGTLPLATPAIADGKVFLGGGYGSFDFYAFDAATGALAWQMHTKDDGPTAAVVEDGLVAFNTESCTVIVAEAKTGNVVWQEWLGDPLMSQPAIWQGRLYMAYPAKAPQSPDESRPGWDATHPHRLLCADLKTGKHLWERPITGDVISAPIVANKQVLFTCFDGTSFCLDAEKGSVVWEKANQGTSAPVVAKDQIVFTQKEVRDGKTFEGIRRADSRKGTEVTGILVADRAEYLDAPGVSFRGLGGSHEVEIAQAATIVPVSYQALDASVGFGTPPPNAKLDEAVKNVGVATVAAAWAFQGSRAAYGRGQFMNAQGSFLNCISEAGSVAWRAEARLSGFAPGAQMFSPPSLGRENLYLCSIAGHVAKVRQKDGAPAFMYATKVPMASQPSLSDGNVYVGTATGLLICLKTGDRDADGWTAWGGNARHNKTE